MTRDLGTMGEAKFLSLCAGKNLTANKSTIDKVAFDYVVDFPINRHVSIAESPLQCRVQVKSTETSKKSASITFDNWLRYCNYPGPYFVAFFEYGPGDDPENLYIVHFDEKLIKMGLNKIADRNANQTGQKRFSLKYDDSHLVELSSQGLKKFLSDTIGRQSEYCRHKLDLLDSIEQTEYSFKVTFEGTDEQITKSKLGLEKLSVLNARHIEKSFGVETKSEESRGGELRITPHFDKAVVRFRKNAFSHSIEFECEYAVVSTPVFGSRFKNNFFEIVSIEKRLHLSIIPWLQKTRYSVLELSNRLTLLSMLLEDEIIFEIIIGSDIIPIPARPRPSLFQDNRETIERQLAFLLLAKKILQEFNVTSEVSLSLTELEIWGEGYKRFMEYLELFTTFSNSNSKGGMSLQIQTIEIPVGNITLGVLYYVVGEFREDADGIKTLDTSRLFIKEKYVVQEEKQHTDWLLNLMHQIAKENESKYEILPYGPKEEE